MSRDRIVTRLIQREILDGDDKRLDLIVNTVFKELFADIVGLCREIAPAFDPFLLSISIISLTVHHYQIAGVQKFLPGNHPRYDAPEVIAGHIVRLLFEGIGFCQNVIKNKTLQGV